MAISLWLRPLVWDDQGEAFNINADLVAGKLAEELNAEKLIMMDVLQA